MDILLTVMLLLLLLYSYKNMSAYLAGHLLRKYMLTLVLIVQTNCYYHSHLLLIKTCQCMSLKK